ncbi:MAG: NIPSNAP family protein [Pirellulaceae bacterium]|nr:NIPSNAP family protein [Pirellulaceae bacterium]
MVRWLTIIVAAGTWWIAMETQATSQDDSRLYEMRVYYAAPGKLDALHERFRNHTVRLFEKHGMENVGYWTPIDNTDSRLIYFLAYPDRDARDNSWKAFMADPEWQSAYKASEVDGRLVRKVETAYFSASDYSPKIVAHVKGDRVFELRTYTATAGNIDALHQRFREHTVKLFAKHGMTNIAYWTPVADQKRWSDKLLYILAHPSREAAQTSFTNFRQDPVWLAVRSASEERAGGSLTATENGVLSEFLVATDYSPIR